MLGALDAFAACALRDQHLKRGDPQGNENGRMERRRVRLQRAVIDSFRNFLAAVLRAGHVHLSALALHHAAAGTFFGRHRSVWRHARHRRRHTGHQQQQKRSELA
jgi:hypothetical protein